MGADVLVVVNISTGLSEREEAQSVVGIVDQLSTLLTYRGTAQQLATLMPQDILIAPALGAITSSAFDRVAEAIPIGAGGHGRTGRPAQGPVAAPGRIRPVSGAQEAGGFATPDHRLHSPR